MPTPQGPRDLPLASVVIPVLDEADGIAATLDHVAALPGRWEVVVADGGSRDGTAEQARAHPCAPRVVDAPRGRARQQNAGAAAATGDVLVFLHADSRLPAGAHAAIREALRDPAVAGGNFALRFDGEDRFARMLGHWYRAQQALGIYYGDSTLWLRRGTWDALGGFRDVAIMEDYDLVRRLGRHGGAVRLPGPATTSGRRWRGLGVPATVASWVVIRWLWLAGVPPAALARLYRNAR